MLLRHGVDPNDPLSETKNQLMMFTDSDRAISVDTRCSHGCHVIMFAGWLLRTGASHTNRLGFHQRRPSITKRPKDVESWYTSAASFRLSTAPIVFREAETHSNSCLSVALARVLIKQNGRAASHQYTT